MKKILYGLVLLMTTSAFATNPFVDEKITKAFSQTFPDASNAKWYDYKDHYEVMFTHKEIPCRMSYDLRGSVVSLRRDYYEKDLPLFILAKVKQKYTSKKIFGVTEITSEEGLSYTIILEDEKHRITVKSNASGDFSTIEKASKA